MTTLLSVPPRPSRLAQGTFSGHETFPFRYAWLKKGVDGLLKQPDIFQSEDAMVELGVGKNMVRSIRHWCLATRVVEEGDLLPNNRTRQIMPSSLGRALFGENGWDVYLQDDASLWLLHWHLATNAARATTIYWAFNHYADQEFTLSQLGQGLARWVETNNKASVSASSLHSDLSCFLRTYIATRRGPASTAEETLDCPLTNLGLLTELPMLEEKRYRFNNGVKHSLTAAVFAYALIDCWDNRHGGQKTLSLRQITHEEGSPGRVFRLNEDAVMEYLDRLADLTQGRLAFKDDALVRQVVRAGELQGRELLDAYYGE